MMFVNDIITSINTDLDGIFSTEELKLSLDLFADDQVLFSTSPTTLQSMLNAIETFFITFNFRLTQKYMLQKHKRKL